MLAHTNLREKTNVHIYLPTQLNPFVYSLIRYVIHPFTLIHKHPDRLISPPSHSLIQIRTFTGDLTTAYHDGSCTHTNEGENSWWQVDLGADTNICGIVSVLITNRACHAECSECSFLVTRIYRTSLLCRFLTNAWTACFPDMLSACSAQEMLCARSHAPCVHGICASVTITSVCFSFCKLRNWLGYTFSWLFIALATCFRYQGDRSAQT